MTHVEYDATRESLYHPGNASNFFQLGPRLDFGIQANEAILCAEMSRLAYVKDEGLLTQYLARADFQGALTIGYGSNGTQLFIAKKQDADLFVVAYRGTEPDDPSDLFTDADFRQVTWQNADGSSVGKVHKGFADTLLDSGILKEVISNLGAPLIAKRVLLTGHSLGAALATLTASWIPNAGLYTFGSPRVGDDEFAGCMRNVKHYRYVDCCDLVTRVPPEKLVMFKYKHTGNLKYIDRDGTLHDSPGESIIETDRHEAAKWYLTHQAFLRGTVFSRDLADHAPINYVSGVMGLRG